MSNNVPNRYDIEKEAGIAADGLCAECFDAVISKHCNNPDAGKREIEYIESHSEKRMYKSEGKHLNHNNGCNWPKRI